MTSCVRRQQDCIIGIKCTHHRLGVAAIERRIPGGVGGSDIGGRIRPSDRYGRNGKDYY